MKSGGEEEYYVGEEEGMQRVKGKYGFVMQPLLLNYGCMRIQSLIMDGCLKTSWTADPPTIFTEILPSTSITIKTKYILLNLSPNQSLTATTSLTHQDSRPSNVIWVLISIVSLLLI
jgi:hypothetical protein